MNSRHSDAAVVSEGQPSIRQWQEEFYQTLHQHPELGHQEVKTAAKVSELLGSYGFDVHDNMGSTGVIGILRNGDGPVVLMRADMDALPVAEATGLPYASTDQATRADTMCTWPACWVLPEHRESWSGTYIALFQPAEELADGATTMVEDGLAELIPKLDVALGQHVLALSAGPVGTRPGAFLSSGDSMRVTVWGRVSHESMPHLAVDPVVLASSIVMRLQSIVSREVPPGEFAVLTVGRLQAGTKSNIISNQAVLELNIRTFS